eukprot:11228317-Lingulodinium_polyedra.AAC.2
MALAPVLLREAAPAAEVDFFAGPPGKGAGMDESRPAAALATFAAFAFGLPAGEALGTAAAPGSMLIKSKAAAGSSMSSSFSDSSLSSPSVFFCFSANEAAAAACICPLEVEAELPGGLSTRPSPCATAGTTSPAGPRSWTSRRHPACSCAGSRWPTPSPLPWYRRPTTAPAPRRARPRPSTRPWS